MRTACPPWYHSGQLDINKSSTKSLLQWRILTYSWSLQFSIIKVCPDYFWDDFLIQRNLENWKDTGIVKRFIFQPAGFHLLFVLSYFFYLHYQREYQCNVLSIFPFSCWPQHPLCILLCHSGKGEGRITEFVIEPQNKRGRR